MTAKNNFSIKPLTRTFLIELLKLAVHAPSGDNSQPWRFRVDERTITLFNIPNADSTLYNFRQRGSYFAHGAVIENLSILAEAEGYRIDVLLFPPAEDATAQITFVRAAPFVSPLVQAIATRASNRKAYGKIPLEDRHRNALSESINGRNDISLRFVEGRADIDLLAQTVSVNEHLLMENRTLHDFLFGIIRWTHEEERLLPGLFLKTMELPPPVQVLFRYVLRYWNAVAVLNRFGLSRFIPKQSAPVYGACSAFGAVILDGDTDSDFVSAGRAFQRIWLTATAAGMRIQPVTAIPYLAQRVTAGHAEAFTLHQQELITGANSVIAQAFRLRGKEHVAMLFRIGYGDDPTAVSAKIPPIILGD